MGDQGVPAHRGSPCRSRDGRGTAVRHRRVYTIVLLGLGPGRKRVHVPTRDRLLDGTGPHAHPRGALAVAESGGQLYAIGGYDGSGNSAAVEVYDPATNTWTKKAPLPTPRDHLAAATVGGKVYAIGGRPDRDYWRHLAINEAYH